MAQRIRQGQEREVFFEYLPITRLDGSTVYLWRLDASRPWRLARELPCRS